jgi:hypothetical protein
MRQHPTLKIDDMSRQAIAQEVINQMVAAEEESQPINTLDKPNPDLLGTNESVRIIDTLLDDGLQENIKKKTLLKKYWSAFSKAPKVTFLEKKDIITFENMFDTSTVSLMMGQATSEFTFEDMLDLDQMKMNFLFSLKRSVGTQRMNYNERTIIGTSIQQRISSHTEGMRGVATGGGFVNKLRNFFG